MKIKANIAFCYFDFSWNICEVKKGTDTYLFLDLPKGRKA
jgi:hypothetical protein